MSPTEFSNYIKQRAMQQQIHHHHHQQPSHSSNGQQPHQASQSTQPNGGMQVSQSSPNSRSLSPGLGGNQDPSAYFFQQGPGYHPQFPPRSMFDATPSSYLPTDLYNPAAKFPSSFMDPAMGGHQFYGNGVNGAGNGGSPSGNLGPVGSSTVGGGGAGASATQQQDKTSLVEGLNNFGLGNVTPYPASQYQHLLVAN